MRRIVFTVAFFVLTKTLAAQACSGLVFDGICFPQGAASFADAVLLYDPLAGGACAPTNPAFADPNDALGAPNGTGTTCATGAGSVSLGEGGVIELAFLNNLLTNSGDAQPDLHVFERGTLEFFFVALRPVEPAVTGTLMDTDGDGYYEIPGPVTGQPTSIDIDAYLPGVPAGQAKFDAVRIQDDFDSQPTCTCPGAEVDAVGAIAAEIPVYPGSAEDFILLTGVNAASPSTGPGNDLKLVTAGDLVSALLVSPGGTFNALPIFLIGQAFLTGSPPGSPPGFPELHVNPAAIPMPVLLLGGPAGPFGPTVLIPGGNGTGFVVPAGLPGASVIIQAIVQTPAAANGFFGATDAHELRII